MYEAYLYDHWYLLLCLVPFLISLWASANVKMTFAKYSKKTTSSHMTGNMAASAVLRKNNVTGVGIGSVAGDLTDNFNPKTNTIYLSQSVGNSNSIAAVGVAAHEAGHAVQFAGSYAPMRLRSALVPVANLGSSAGFYLAILGVFMSFDLLIYLGIALFGGFVLFQLVTLPVELDASRRALAALEATGTLNKEELKGAKKVLTAAAMTYLVALGAAVANLIRLLLIAKRDDR